MTTIAYSPVNIQTSTESVSSIPCWFGEITLIVSHLQHQGVLTDISEQVRFARRRFGRYEVIDFLAVQIALCRQRRADAGSFLRADPPLEEHVHGALRTRSLACAFDAQPLSRCAGSERSRVPAHPVSHRWAFSSSGKRGAVRRAIRPAGEPLPRLRR